MEPHSFDPFHSLSLDLGISDVNFKPAYDANGIHEGEARWLFYFFVNKSASAILYARRSADSSNGKSSRKTTVKSMYLTTCPQVVNFLIEKYTIDEIIAKTVSAITKFAP